MRAWRGWPRRWPSSLPEAEVLRFPAWDCLPYDRVSPNPALVSERIATLARLLEKPDAAAHRADHGERAGAARSAALGVRRRQPGAAHQRHRAAGEARPLPGGQRLRPRRHGDGAGRIRHARRHHRRLPGRRGGPGAARPVRRHDRVDPRLRSGHPAQRRSTPAPDPAAGLRGAARSGRDLAVPLRLARDLRPAGGRRPDLSVDLGRAAASRHGALGAAVPRADGDAARLPARAPRSAWTTRRTRCWRRGSR